MKWFLVAAAMLHVAFMICELFPWSSPLLLEIAGKKALPANESFTPAQRRLVAAILHNAGVYNGIVAGGLVWAALGGNSAIEVGRVMLAGAVVAGVFGTLTLKSWITAVQAVVGAVGLFLL